MSESTRADLRISNCDANCDHSLPVTDSEFAALVRQWIAEHPDEAYSEIRKHEGYPDSMSPGDWRGLLGLAAENVAKKWIAEHPAEAMRELFTEPCMRCRGSGDEEHGPGGVVTGPCHNCGGSGRVLKDGVWDEWWCDAPSYAKQHGGCQPGDDFYPHRHDLCGQRVSFPAERMEGDDGVE